MIPINAVSNIKIITHPTKTYYLDTVNKRIVGMTDGLDAMEQAIYKLLLTERFEYPIYDYRYGTELKDLYGKDVYLACAVLERRITDALMADDRISGVYDFSFSTSKNTVYAKFTVATVLGELREGVSVNV